jgi:hypothetical protein
MQHQQQVRQRKLKNQSQSNDEEILLATISSRKHVQHLFVSLCSNLIVPLVLLAPPILYLCFIYTKVLLFFILPWSMFNSHVKWLGVTYWTVSDIELQQSIIRDQIMVCALGALLVFLWVFVLTALLLQQVDWKHANYLHKSTLLFFILFGPLSSAGIFWILIGEAVIRVLLTVLLNLGIITFLKYKFLPLVKEDAKRARIDQHSYQPVLISE